MTTDLHDQLIRLANHFGSDVAYARAGGGNASVKHDGVLYIKPSGTTLATLRDEDLVALRIDVLLDALRSDVEPEGDPVMAAAAAARVGDPDGRRPSVEILFHALIDDPLVLHLHPLVANAVTCNSDGRALAARLFGDEVVWVDYIDPGVPLARGVERARQEFTERTGTQPPAITLMGNHGIIVSGSSFDEVAERIDWLTATTQAAIDDAPAAMPVTPAEVAVDDAEEALRQAAGKPFVAVAADELVRAAASVGSAPVSRGPLIPDQIVYSGSRPAVLDGHRAVDDAIAEHRAEFGKAPIVAVIPGRAVLAVGDSQRTADIALGTFLDALQVARDADRLGGTRVMDERERHFIEHWEAEAYRQKVNQDS